MPRKLKKRTTVTDREYNFIRSYFRRCALIHFFLICIICIGMVFLFYIQNSLNISNIFFSLFTAPCFLLLFYHAYKCFENIRTDCDRGLTVISVEEQLKSGRDFSIEGVKLFFPRQWTVKICSLFYETKYFTVCTLHNRFTKSIFAVEVNNGQLRINNENNLGAVIRGGFWKLHYLVLALVIGSVLIYSNTITPTDISQKQLRLLQKNIGEKKIERLRDVEKSIPVQLPSVKQLVNTDCIIPKKYKLSEVIIYRTPRYSYISRLSRDDLNLINSRKAAANKELAPLRKYANEMNPLYLLHFIEDEIKKEKRVNIDPDRVLRMYLRSYLKKKARQLLEQNDRKKASKEVFSETLTGRFIVNLTALKLYNNSSKVNPASKEWEKDVIRVRTPGDLQNAGKKRPVYDKKYSLPVSAGSRKIIQLTRSRGFMVPGDRKTTVIIKKDALAELTKPLKNHDVEFILLNVVKETVTDGQIRSIGDALVCSSAEASGLIKTTDALNQKEFLFYLFFVYVIILSARFIINNIAVRFISRISRKSFYTLYGEASNVDLSGSLSEPVTDDGKISLYGNQKGRISKVKK